MEKETSEVSVNTDEVATKNVQNITKPVTFYFYFNIFIVILLIISSGTGVTWTSPAINKLLSNNTEINPLKIPITTNEISMLMGIPTLFSLIGALGLPKLADLIGRMNSLHTTGLGILLSVTGLAFSDQVWLFITYRSFFNMFFSGLWGILPIYIIEICEDHNRAKYSCMTAVFLIFGQLYTYIIGSYFSLRDFTLLTLFPLVCFLLSYFFLVESPIYLLSKRKNDDCKKTIKKLRGNKTDEELEADFIAISKHLNSNEEKRSFGLNLFKTKEGRIGMLLALLPILTQIFSGVPIISSLLGPIFQNVNNDLSGDTVAIIVGVVQMIVYLLASLIIDKTGRKLVLLISSIGTGVFALILGFCFYFQYSNISIINSVKWLPVVAVLGYIVFFSIGLGPIPISLTSELFLPEVRCTALTIIVTINTIAGAIYGFSFPVLADLIGTYYCLWIFCICCFIGAVLIFMFLPEIKGKTIIEIQDMLKKY